jgi:hypothetical protein
MWVKVMEISKVYTYQPVKTKKKKIANTFKALYLMWGGGRRGKGGFLMSSMMFV